MAVTAAVAAAVGFVLVVESEPARPDEPLLHATAVSTTAAATSIPKRPFIVISISA
ncbi:MAG: hypothetical protein ACXVJW_19735 [Acidimicrobiia bacterium]